jgi:hypothetical protein
MLENIILEPILSSVARIQMEDPEYFALDAISNSKLSLINPEQDGSPQRFFMERKNNESTALELGSAVHALLLEKDKNYLSEFEKPGGKIPLLIKTAFNLTTRDENPIEYNEALTIACKIHDYYSTSLTDNRLSALKEKGQAYFEYLGQENKPGAVVLTTDQRDKCLKCTESVKNNTYITALLYPKVSDTFLSFDEDVILMDIKAIFTDDLISSETLLKIKGKIDNWSIDLVNNKITMNDLKTTGKPLQFFPGRWQEDKYSMTGERIFIEGSFQKFHYNRQLAFYMAMLLAYCNKIYGERDWELAVNIIAVETIYPFRSQIFKIGEDTLSKGMKEYNELLKRVAYHTKYSYSSIPELEGKPCFLIP